VSHVNRTQQKCRIKPLSSELNWTQLPAELCLKKDTNPLGVVSAYVTITRNA